MTRLAENRTTHLTREELSEEALRQFGARTSDPTIRSLAEALGVAPTAIYHHFPSRAAIFQAVVERVWNEALDETLRLVPAPFEADPAEVLVAVGVATRRAWLTHHRVARYMAATPEANEFTRTALGLMAHLFEHLGLEPEDAASAFHSYSSFMIGAVLFAANRESANEQLETEGPVHSGPSAPSPGPTQRLINEVMDLSITDPDRDEQLFKDGLWRLIRGLTGPAGPPDG